MATIVDVETGMTEYFMANAAVVARIGRRFYKVACKEWILTLENIQQERSPRTGQWADYRRSGRQVNRMKGGLESKLHFASFEIRAYGQVMEDAEALMEALTDVIGASYAGTWGTLVPVTIKNAHWQYDQDASDYDDAFRQAYASRTLLVPFRTS